MDAASVTGAVLLVGLGGCILWLAWSRRIALLALDRAATKAETWEKRARDMNAAREHAYDNWTALLHADQQRKAALSARMRAIGIKGNQSDKRKRKGA